MVRLITITLITILACCMMPAMTLNAQYAPMQVECVSGFGSGGTEYLIIDEVFHIREAGQSEWTPLPLPPGAPEGLKAAQAKNDVLVYRHSDHGENGGTVSHTVFTLLTSE